MQGKDDSAVLKAFEALNLNSLPACAVHPDRAAEFVCDGCNTLMCREDTRFLAKDDSIRCDACLEATKPPTWQVMLKTPFVYVAAAALMTLVAYAGGCGRVDIEALLAADKAEEWVDQQAPRLMLAQAGRMHERAEREGTNPAEARRWATRAHNQFLAVRRLWEDEIPAPFLLLAESLCLITMGEELDAIARLEALSHKLSEPRSEYLRRYHLGELYFRADRNAEAMALWGSVVEVTNPLNTERFNNLVDGMLKTVDNNRGEVVELRILLRECGVYDTLEETVARINNGYDERDIDAPRGLVEPGMDANPYDITDLEGGL